MIYNDIASSLCDANCVEARDSIVLNGNEREKCIYRDNLVKNSGSTKMVSKILSVGLPQKLDVEPTPIIFHRSLLH